MIQYKEAVGDNLYCINFPDGTVIPFRLLTNREYAGCRTSLTLGNIPSEQVYWHIYVKCVLDVSFTENLKGLKAGIPLTVARLVYHMSGPTTIEFVGELMDAERAAAQTLESQMKSTICRTFSGYTMDKLDDLDFPTLVSIFAKAEAILLDTQVIERPFELSSGTGPKRDLAQQLEEDAKATRRALLG